jgi:hypothetical protein
MVRANLQQLDVRPLLDGICYRVRTGVDCGDERDGLVKEPVERVDERRREQFHLTQLVDDHNAAALRGPFDCWHRQALKRGNIYAVAGNHRPFGESHMSEQGTAAANLFDAKPDPLAVFPDFPREEPADGDAARGQFSGQPAHEGGLARPGRTGQQDPRHRRNQPRMHDHCPAGYLVPRLVGAD